MSFKTPTLPKFKKNKIIAAAKKKLENAQNNLKRAERRVANLNVQTDSLSTRPVDEITHLLEQIHHEQALSVAKETLLDARKREKNARKNLKVAFIENNQLMRQKRIKLEYNSACRVAESAVTLSMELNNAYKLVKQSHDMYEIHNSKIKSTSLKIYEELRVLRKKAKMNAMVTKLHMDLLKPFDKSDDKII